MILFGVASPVTLRHGKGGKRYKFYRQEVRGIICALVSTQSDFENKTNNAPTKCFSTSSSSFIIWIFDSQISSKLMKTEVDITANFNNFPLCVMPTKREYLLGNESGIRSFSHCQTVRARQTLTPFWHLVHVWSQSMLRNLSKLCIKLGNINWKVT